MAITLEINVIKWLSQNAPYIKLIEWSGKSIIKSKFIDTNRNVEFWYKFSNLKYKLKNNLSVALSKEEIENKRKQTFLKKYDGHPFKNKKIQEKIKQTCLKKYGVENPNQSKEIQEKIKQTNLKKYGCENPSQNKEIKEKKKQTCLMNHECENPFGNKKVQEKIKQTNLKKYGYKNPSQNKKVQQKRKQTFLKKYGVEHVLKNKQIQERFKQTCLKNYGVEYPQQSKEIRNKTLQTNLKKYNVKTPAKNKQIKEKQRQTKIKKGLIKYVVNDKTLMQWSENKNLGSYTTLIKGYKQNIHPLKIKCKTSVLELKVKEFLDKNKINYIHNKALPEHKGIKEGHKRPDFLLPEFNLIIECDGEYWHQDKNKDSKRNNLYENFSYKVLCFSGQEIENDWDKVKKEILIKLEEINNATL